MTEQQAGIGDVKSDAKGSGARFNAGKVALELIPLRIIADTWEMNRAAPENADAIDALYQLAAFQEGGDASHLYIAVDRIGAAWDECAAVFTYGKKKYAAWNWAKGMPWSVPIACAARHLVNGILAGEQLDKESGLTHRGHFLCNIVMLLTYFRTYREGDDRPSQWLCMMSHEPMSNGMKEHLAREKDACQIAEANQFYPAYPTIPFEAYSDGKAVR